MSSPTPPLNSTASQSSLIPLNYDAKDASKIGVTTLALNALSEQIASSDFTFRANGRDKMSQQELEGILRLEKSEKSEELEKLPLLKLSAREKALLDQIFSSWSLDNRISLIELWGVDVYKALKKLAEHLPAGLINRFKTQFLLGYASSLVQEFKEKYPDYRSVGILGENEVQKGHKFVIGKPRWIAEFIAIRETLGKQRMALKETSELTTLFVEAEETELWRNPSLQ